MRHDRVEPKNNKERKHKMKYWFKTKKQLGDFVKDYSKNDNFVVFIWAKNEIEESAGKKIKNWKAFCEKVEDDSEVYDADVKLENSLFEIAKKL